MKVWIVFEMEYGGGFNVDRVFSTEEKAQEYKDSRSHYLYIDEFEVDE